MFEPVLDEKDGGGAGGEQVLLRADKAWLLKNRLNPFPVRGELELTPTRLRFTLTKNAVDAVLGWLEEELSQPDLKSRLRAGESVLAFELDRATLQVRWPKQFMGAGMKVSSPGGREWLVSLVYPEGQYYTVFKTLTGRSEFKEWKNALAGGA